MAELHSWNVSAGSNNGAAPNGAPEGQTAGSLNDCIREVMAVLAREDRDNDGSLVTATSTTAFTVALNRVGIAAWYNGLRWRARIHSTCGATPTINLTPNGGSALGAKSLYWPDGTQVTTGDLVTAGVYDFVYESGADKVYVLSARGPGVAPTRAITAGLGLSGGGDLSSDRTVAFDPTELSVVTIASNDKLVLQDVSDSGTPKTGLVSDILTLANVKYAIIRDEKADGTDGGASTSGGYEDRVLNTELYDPSGIVTLSGNAFTPIAGVYLAIVTTPHVWGNATGYKQQLYNNTTGPAQVQVGISARGGSSGADGLMVSHYSFTANGTDAYKIRQQVGASRATDGMGGHDQLTLGVEVYAQVLLIKVS